MSTTLMDQERAILIEPNKAKWKGTVRKIAPVGAPFGVVSDGFFSKQELLEIAKSLGLAVRPNPTRKELSTLLLCNIKRTFTRSARFNPDDRYLKWAEDKKLPDAPWTAMQDNGIHSQWFKNNVKSWEDLQEYMYGVVLERLPSPFYEFGRQNTSNEENQDNAWWGSKAHELIVKINKTRKMITTDSQTIDTRCNSGSRFYRSYLEALMQEEDVVKFEDEMNARGFFCWSARNYGTSGQAPYGNIYQITLRPYIMGATFPEEYFHPFLQEELDTNSAVVAVIDPVNYRPAEDPDGLFTTVLCVLQQTCWLYENEL